MIRFSIDPAKKTAFPHYWELCVGSCHAYTALREDYRQQLRRAHDELGFRYVRFHGLLNDDMCVCVMQRDFAGNPLGVVYNFVNIDNIFDFLLSIGMKPFIELGFMPTALASGEKTCFHYRGNITPPKDCAAWGELVTRLTEHLIARYGRDEVRSWFFEVWNEPNLAFFFAGTKEEYFRLYETSARAIKAVDTALRVGGPATSFNSWVRDTVEYCRKHDVPLDFISTHHYPTDDPLWRSGMDIDEFFKKGMFKDARYGRGVLKGMCERVRKEANGLPVYYTEWNTSSHHDDPLHDEPYAAAMIAKTLADNDGLVEGYSFWTFTDIFEEMSQTPGAFYGGFGLMTTHGVPKPNYRLFALFHGLGTTRLAVKTSSPDATAELLATATDAGCRLIAYNHQVEKEPIQPETIRISLVGIPHGNSAVLWRIDDTHANPKKAWLDMGAPEYPDARQLQKLHDASALVPETIAIENDVIELTLPAHGTAALDIPSK